MYAITGISGKVGGELARTLLDADQAIRAVVRNAGKGETWAALGCAFPEPAASVPRALSPPQSLLRTDAEQLSLLQQETLTTPRRKLLLRCRRGA
jgi:uncharacterized protein YbjT (DUF2867 family)